MTTERTLGTGIRFVAIVLLAVSATDAAFARGTTFHAHHIDRSGQSAGQNATRPASGHTNARSLPRTDHHPPADVSRGPKSGSKIGDVKGPIKGSSPDDVRVNERGGKSRSLIESAPNTKDGGVQLPPSGEAIGKESNSVESRARDANVIDTRITAPSRGTSNNPDKLRALKTFTVVRPRGALERRSTTSDAPNRSTRNAIGVPVVRHLGVQRRDSGSAHAVSIPAGVADVGRSAASSVAKFNGDGPKQAGPERPITVNPSTGGQNTSSPASPIAATRGVIDGSKLLRPGFGPSAIGGPAKTFAGISGTAIRSKH
jgi:hypothetical protein